jgi:hypothetical protein
LRKPLAETGFSGASLLMQDYEDDLCHFSSIIISIASEVITSNEHGVNVTDTTDTLAAAGTNGSHKGE